MVRVLRGAHLTGFFFRRRIVLGAVVVRVLEVVLVGVLFLFLLLVVVLVGFGSEALLGILQEIVQHREARDAHGRGGGG